MQIDYDANNIHSVPYTQFVPTHHTCVNWIDFHQFVISQIMLRSPASLVLIFKEHIDTSHTINV